MKLKFLGCPPNFHYRVMYIAPCSGHILLNLNLQLKSNLRSAEVVF